MARIADEIPQANSNTRSARLPTMLLPATIWDSIGVPRARQPPRAQETNVIQIPQSLPLREPAIYIASMPNVLHDDVQRLCIHLIHDAVIPDSQAVQTLSPLQFSRLRRKRIGR